MVPILIVGAFIALMGFVGEATWPLPGPYNILFFDPYVLFGLLIIGFSVSVWKGLRLAYMGLFALMVGLVVTFYGAHGYSLGLTNAPIALYGLYMAWGFTAIFSFGVSMAFDGMSSNAAKMPAAWRAALIIFWISLIAGVVLAAYIGGSAVSAHLAG